MKLYKEVLENLNAGVLVVDQNLSIVFVNRWFKKALKMSPTDILDRSFIELFPETNDSRLHFAIADALVNHLSSLLSPSLNHRPFPLYKGQHKVEPIEQLIRILPIPFDETQICCMIEITDVSNMVKREKALSNLTKRFSNLALTDELTNIANRRQFNITLDKEIHLATRDKKPLSLIFLDIDFFKSYNDSLGHLAGDNCLITVVNTLLQRIRRGSDQISRYGGDEFCIILPDTNIQTAVDTAESLRAIIYALDMPHPKNEIASCVTITIGAACWDEFNNESASSFILRADSTLYRAKQSGRNSVLGHYNDTWITPSPIT
ncbi:sensor domain-containing diguanylate cyclase [Neptunomonas japonica]|uniref:diguanylate cyclase n=1 Tax=Neptunomonas japonica JAMM 1380 TaxID=1441457 RepID=A0A7R6PF92_9GAMM|nr:diguanylate cyclase [Neptunomonas japonica]BBB28056.1 signal transduction protein [Neptunomonas japonica JAMM 1380]